jgi:membrane protein
MVARSAGRRRFLAGVAGRLGAAQMPRTAAALSFTTVLGMVPLFTVAFVYVARYPLFEQWLDALERFLLRHLLPGSSGIVRGYLSDFTAKAANLQGVSIAFVVVTAVLLVANVERELNAIWGVREPRALWLRAIVCALGIIVGPLVIGATVYSTSCRSPHARCPMSRPPSRSRSRRSPSRCSTR